MLTLGAIVVTISMHNYFQVCLFFNENLIRRDLVDFFQQRPEFQVLRASLYVAMGIVQYYSSITISNSPASVGLFGVLCAPHVYWLLPEDEFWDLGPMVTCLILMVRFFSSNLSCTS